MKPACRQCGSTRRKLSLRGLCGECGAKNQRENTRQLRTKSGPKYVMWQQRTAMGREAMKMRDAYIEELRNR